MQRDPVTGVVVADNATARIRELARASTDGTETGGILLGTDPDARGIITVLHAGDPGPKAVRRADLFVRDLCHAREFAAAAYLADGSTWVGEWHTHPSGPSTPSTRDLATYDHILTETPGLAAFVSIIVTAPDAAWAAPELTCWVFARAVSSPETS